MKIYIYLKSGQTITFHAKDAPQLTISPLTGELLSYDIKGIVGNITPMFINIQEINAITVEDSDSEEA